jgi:F-type H+-transporting ATPase subunit b
MMNMLSILAATEAAEETSEGIGALGLDPIAIAAQAATFLLLLWVVKKYALNGIVKNLDKRHEDINRGLHLSAEMDKQKAELELTVEKAMKAARKDANVILAEAQAESGKIIQAAEESASRKADAILKNAESKIERDIADARKSLKGEMASLITEATEAILNQKLDDKSDRKLVEDYLKEAMK